MSEPTHPEPDDGASDEAGPRSGDLAALLRDEVIPDDELARERRIRTALAAFDQQDPGSAPGAAPVHDRRRRALPWWTAAAAVLVVVGGYFALDIRTESDQLASSDAGSGSAELEEAQAGSPSALDETTVDDLVDLGPQADRDAAVAAATRILGEASSSFEAAQSTTSMQSTTSIDPSSEIAESPAAPTEQDGASSETTGSSGRRSPGAEELACLQQLVASGERPQAVATVDGTAVIVVRRPSGYEVYEITTCRLMT